ncbi:hypothetical protein MMC24_005337 [Lignoscripta atroalba]|nr:hypothetical protein [Lignoscripta atroalba]
MRYAVDWCVYNFPEPNDQWASNPCGVSCAPLSRSLQTNILAPNRSTPYDYCQDPDFIRRVAVCSNCYALIPNQLYISNCMWLYIRFLSSSRANSMIVVFKALRSGCQIQSPPSTTFAIPPSQIFTINPPATYPTSTAPPSSSNRLSRAGVLAIAIIIPVIVVLLLALFAIYWYKRFQKASANPRYPHAQAEFDFSSQYGDQSGIAQSPQEDFAPYPYPDGPQSFPSPGIPLQSQQYPDQKGKQRSEMVIMTESPIHSPYTPPPHSIREEEEGPSISRA